MKQAGFGLPVPIMGSRKGRKGPPQIWSLRRAPGKICHHAILLIGSKGNIRALRCVIGRSGISVFKREGDGATPAAEMGLLGGYMARRAWPVRNRELSAITPEHGWCDAPTHSCYNRPVRLPFSASHERLHRPDGLYDICVVLDWNIAPRQRYRGSAIFFHLARHGNEPTEGCIAVSRRQMDLILRRLATNIVIRVIA